VNPGDDPVEVANEACLSISSQSMPACIGNVVAAVERENYITRSFQRALHKMSAEFDTKMGRHEIMTILKRLRGYASPRRLLVIGAGDDSEAWEVINNRIEGGFTCFLERTLRQHSNNHHESENKEESIEIEYDASNNAFSRVAYEIEESLGSFTLTERDVYEKTMEVSANYSHIPWDVVVLYDFCDGKRRTDKGRLQLDLSIDQVQRCRQAYINYAAERASDDGYVFIQLPQSDGYDNIPNEEGFNLEMLEHKFLFKHELIRHLGSRRPLVYFTSMVSMLSFENDCCCSYPIILRIYFLHKYYK
jgi:hypothetical protein